MQEAYFARFPGYERGITVPAIVDVPSGQVVTNDFAQLTLDLSTEWAAYHRAGAPKLYPQALREEIDDVNARVYREVNNGVYRCGFAGSQDAYDRAYERLFTALDWLSERLSGQRFLVGDTITEADVRLFTTLARFDAVYHGHFKCNLGFTGSSQHLILEGVADHDEMEQVGATEARVARHADDPARNPPALLACDRSRCPYRCCVGGCWRVAAGRAAVVRRGWRRAAAEFDRPLEPVSVLR